MSLTLKWLQLETMMLGKLSQTQYEKYCMLSYMHNIYVYTSYENKSNWDAKGDQCVWGGEPRKNNGGELI